MDDNQENRIAGSTGVANPALAQDVLDLLVGSTAARLGIVWDCSQLACRPLAQSGETDTRFNMSRQQHERLVGKVAERQQMAILRPKKNSPCEDAYVVLAPFAQGGMSIIELIIPELVIESAEAGRDLFRRIQRVCNEVARPSLSTQLSQDGIWPGSVISEYAATVHSSLEEDVAYQNVVNETRRLLACDRVSLVIGRQRRFRISAISGQPAVNRRSRSVRLLESLAACVLKTETELWYPDQSSPLPRIGKALEEYVEHTDCRTLVIHPIFDKPDEETLPSGDASHSKPRRVIGGIVYEHLREQWQKEEVGERLATTTLHSGSAIGAVNQHRALFLYPLWRLLGRTRLVASTRNLGRIGWTVGLAMLVGLFLCFWQVPFYVSATGTFVPAEIRGVFSTVSGKVEEVYVEHEQSVSSGQKLLRISNDELQLQREEIHGRIEALEDRRAAIESIRFGSSQLKGDQVELNLDALEAELKSLERQEQIVANMLDKLQVTSPIDGQVVTWNIEQKLEGRTIAPSDRLMEVANLQDSWDLRIEVGDRHAGRVLAALQAARAGQPLRANFSLATEPGKVYEGRVVSVANTMSLNHENRRVLRLQVKTESVIDLKQVRCEATAKIYLGYDCSLGYLWMCDLPDAWKRYIMFYLVR